MDNPQSINVDSLENLLLLCPKHHKIVDDNPEKYSVEILTAMKIKHENDAAPIEEPSDSLAQRLIEYSSGIEVNIKNSKVRDVVNINVREQKGDINIGTWDPASNYAYNVSHNLGYQDNDYKSDNSIVYCRTCGATPGEKSICTSLTGNHSFTSGKGKIYCRTCGATPGEKSICTSLTGNHSFTTSN